MAESGETLLPLNYSDFIVRDEDRKPLPWDRFNCWIKCFCVVTFDLELGQVIEVGTLLPPPPHTANAVARPEPRQNNAFRPSLCTPPLVGPSGLVHFRAHSFNRGQQGLITLCFLCFQKGLFMGQLATYKTCKFFHSTQSVGYTL